MASILQKITPRKKNQGKKDHVEELSAERSDSYTNSLNEDNQSEVSITSDTSDPSPCGQCRKLVKEDDPAMRCEICEQWFHIKFQQMTKAEYNYIEGGSAKKKALNKLHWYCSTCDRVSVNYMKKLTSLHIKQQKLEEKINALEENINKKATKEDIQKLKNDLTTQKKVQDEHDKKLKELTEQKQKNNSWADIVSKEEAEKEVEDKIEKRLKEKDDEEKARKDRMKNIIVHGLDEAEGADPLERRAKDIKEVQNILREFCEVELNDEDIVKTMRLGKYDQTKKRPILIGIKTEERKREIFQNLHKLRNAPENISVAHDLTKKQREELQELIKDARKKEENDQSGNFMYRVRGPPWGWFIKKISKK